MSRLPDDIVEVLKSVAGSPTAVSPVGGGCINNGAKVETSQGVFFLKWNDGNAFPGMFQDEARGLRLLADAGAIRIPEVVSVLDGGDHEGLLLEYIPSRRSTPLSGERLGRQLAELHRTRGESYGLDHDNWMGSLRQYNEPCDDLIDFFIRRRLEPQVDLAFSKGAFSDTFSGQLDRLFEKLPDLLVKESPCLIHGDLWGGNYMVTESEEPVLIDPAVAYGHREMDLAMTTLFGGFPDTFYDVYQETYPLEDGYRDRMDIYNLYPLLVHVNLFGGGYAAQVRSIVSRFV